MMTSCGARGPAGARGDVADMGNELVNDCEERERNEVSGLRSRAFPKKLFTGQVYRAAGPQSAQV